MKNKIFLLLIICNFHFFAGHCFAQSAKGILSAGTPIPVRIINQANSSKDTTVKAVVENNITDKAGNILIAQDAPVDLRVKISKPKQSGVEGKIEIDFVSVNAVDGQRIELTGNYSVFGKSRKSSSRCLTCCMTPLYGVGLLFLLIKGAPAIILANTVIADSAKVSSDYTVVIGEKKITTIQQTPQKENEDQSQYRGGGDPLKGLNVNKATTIEIGDYYALIIGVDKYSGSWNPLKNAVRDAKAVEMLLKEEYKVDYFKTLFDEQATRKNIIKEMEWLGANVKAKDNVLIYYSGHGQFKQDLNKGFWVPVDAQTTSTSDYISNNDIQTYLDGIKSKHTLLISDACFSGDIFRGSTISVPFENSERYYRDVHNLASRQALTSGGIEPVMDGGKEGHSIFAYYLLKALINNQTKFYDASQLYSTIKIPVTNNSEQSPQFQSIKGIGDEGGQFIFIKK